MTISRRRLPDYVKTLHQKACHTCSTIICLHSTNQIIDLWCCCWRCRCQINLKLPDIKARSHRQFLRRFKRRFWRRFLWRFKIARVNQRRFRGDLSPQNGGDFKHARIFEAIYWQFLQFESSKSPWNRRSNHRKNRLGKRALMQREHKRISRGSVVIIESYYSSQRYEIFCSQLRA